MKPQCTATIKLVTEEVRKCIVALECYKNMVVSKEIDNPSVIVESS